MDEQLYGLFRCPDCGAELNVEKAGEGFSCRACAHSFPVRDGIPRFVKDSAYCGSFGLQWNRHRKAQMDSHNGFSFSRERLFSSTGWNSSLAGQLILEAGSGAGRFTEILAGTGATVYSFDLSSAVEANHENNPGAVVFQADIYRIPLARSRFDKILCLGMLQHTPDPEKSFLSLVPMLKPGGEIVIDIYKRSPAALLHWKYVLRPLLKRMEQERLYRLSCRLVDVFGRASGRARRWFGPAGARIFPVCDYSHLVPAGLNRELSILDTFDMYAPAYDRPASLASVRSWFEKSGLKDIRVSYGPNGIVAKGRR